MFEIIKNVIREGRYNLSALLVKIDTLWVQGSLTEAQKTELVGLAQGNASFKNSVDVTAKLLELEQRIKALETADEALGAAAEYVAGKWYYAGDKVSFEGGVYVCTAPAEQVCTWSPAEYPAYWEAVTQTEVQSDENIS